MDTLPSVLLTYRRVPLRLMNWSSALVVSCCWLARFSYSTARLLDVNLYFHIWLSGSPLVFGLPRIKVSFMIDSTTRGSRYPLHALLIEERCPKYFLERPVTARDWRFRCDIDSTRTAPVHEHTGKTSDSLAAVIGEP